MPRTPDHAASAEKWLAWAEQNDPKDTATIALIAQTHALLAIGAHLGAVRVRPSARPFVPDAWLDADEAAIDRVRAASATDEQRGMRGVTPSLVIVDEMDEPGWHRAAPEEDG